MFMNKKLKPQTYEEVYNGAEIIPFERTKYAKEVFPNYLEAFKLPGIVYSRKDIATLVGVTQGAHFKSLMKREEVSNPEFKIYKFHTYVEDKSRRCPRGLLLEPKLSTKKANHYCREMLLIIISQFSTPAAKRMTKCVVKAAVLGKQLFLAHSDLRRLTVQQCKSKNSVFDPWLKPLDKFQKLPYYARIGGLHYQSMFGKTKNQLWAELNYKKAAGKTFKDFLTKPWLDVWQDIDFEIEYYVENHGKGKTIEQLLKELKLLCEQTAQKSIKRHKPDMDDILVENG